MHIKSLTSDKFIQPEKQCDLVMKIMRRRELQEYQGKKDGLMCEYLKMMLNSKLQQVYYSSIEVLNTNHILLSQLDIGERSQVM